MKRLDDIQGFFQNSNHLQVCFVFRISNLTKMPIFFSPKIIEPEHLSKERSYRSCLKFPAKYMSNAEPQDISDWSLSIRNNRFNIPENIKIMTYRVINLRMPKSKPLLSHYLLSEHVFILGAFNQFSAYILIFEIGFLKFQNLIFGPKWWDF